MRWFIIPVLAFAACRPELPKLRTLPDFHLFDAGKMRPSPISSSDLRGSPWVADFIFTSCSGPCPTLTLRMASLQKSLPPGVRLVSFTVDPDTDSPDILRDYARRNGADPRRWRFVTGDKAELLRLLRDGFSLPIVKDKSQAAGVRVTHSTKFALVDAEMNVRGYYDGNDQNEIAVLVKDARSLAP